MNPPAAERHATCHERVACPYCGAPVGQRCVRVNAAVAPWGRYAHVGPDGAPPPLKHPHRERIRRDRYTPPRAVRGSRPMEV
jgi:hypothetical protein